MELFWEIIILAFNLLLISFFIIHIRRLRVNPTTYQIPFIVGITFTSLYVFIMLYASIIYEHGEEMLGVILALIIGIPIIGIYFAIIYFLSRLKNWVSYLFYSILVSILTLVFINLLGLLLFDYSFIYL